MNHMESIFFKNFLQKENQPLLKVFLAVLILLVLLVAYLIFDIKRGDKDGVTAPPSVLTVKQEGKAGNGENKPVVSESQSVAGPQIQVTATDPRVKAVIDKVFKHVFLPSGNVNVETILKPDELRKANPVFYQLAKEGDQLLVYSDRAILYDPVADRVLDIIHISK